MTKHRKALHSSPRLAGCQTPLRGGLIFLVIYAVLMMGVSAFAWDLAPWLASLSLVLAQVLLGVGVLCLYRLQKAARWGAVGVILLLGAGLTLAPPSVFLVNAIQALALAGFSLVLYDVDKVSGVPLRLPGGLIFLAVIAVLLNSPLMGFVGAALLALGAAMGLARLR